MTACEGFNAAPQRTGDVPVNAVQTLIWPCRKMFEYFKTVWLVRQILILPWCQQCNSRKLRSHRRLWRLFFPSLRASDDRKGVDICGRLWLSAREGRLPATARQHSISYLWHALLLWATFTSSFFAWVNRSHQRACIFWAGRKFAVRWQWNSWFTDVVWKSGSCWGHICLLIMTSH